MAALVFGKTRQTRNTHLTGKDLTVINKALKSLEQPLAQDEKQIGEFELSPKERLLLQQIRTVKKKLAILRKLKL